MDRRAFLGCLPAGVLAATVDDKAAKAECSGPGWLLCGDPIGIEYIIQIDQYVQHTDQPAPNESYMRPFEECLEIPEQGVDDFRRTVMAFVGHMVLRNGKFEISDSPQLNKACKMIREHKLGEVRDGKIFLFSPPDSLFA